MNNEKWGVYTHTHTQILYYSVKTNKQTNQEMLSLVTTWVNLEGVMLTEISLLDKDKYHMILLIYRIKNKTAITHTHTHTCTQNIKQPTHRYREQVWDCLRQGVGQVCEDS